MTDTSQEIACARLMALTGSERFLKGMRMGDAARGLVMASLPSNLSETERKEMLFQRFYGESLPHPLMN